MWLKKKNVEKRKKKIQGYLLIYLRRRACRKERSRKFSKLCHRVHMYCSCFFARGWVCKYLGENVCENKFCIISFLTSLSLLPCGFLQFFFFRVYSSYHLNRAHRCTKFSLFEGIYKFVYIKSVRVEICVRNT